ncbi:unnamed protein product [Darwinula stevensoni]|uniref:Transmembrane protein n=1 Tax=Darwinula stevensoni TaxID=69355 RepID=A0A7R8XCP8_9CRUS|nr:unnamed protein product [Darwinula stevensoni]CAG0889059.1 unnamed protein product [Darwinula stevensoni]
MDFGEMSGRANGGPEAWNAASSPGGGREHQGETRVRSPAAGSVMRGEPRGKDLEEEDDEDEWMPGAGAVRCALLWGGVFGCGGVMLMAVGISVKRYVVFAYVGSTLMVIGVGLIVFGWYFFAGRSGASDPGKGPVSVYVIPTREGTASGDNADARKAPTPPRPAHRGHPPPRRKHSDHTDVAPCENELYLLRL